MYKYPTVIIIGLFQYYITVGVDAITERCDAWSQHRQNCNWL